MSSSKFLKVSIASGKTLQPCKVLKHFQTWSAIETLQRGESEESFTVSSMFSTMCFVSVFKAVVKASNYFAGMLHLQCHL